MKTVTNRNLRGSVVHSENKFISPFRHNKQKFSVFRVYLVNRKYFLVCELVCYLIVWQNAKTKSEFVVRIKTKNIHKHDCVMENSPYGERDEKNLKMNIPMQLRR